MSLINNTYFQKRNLYVPNLKDEVLDQLTDYINTYEDLYLDKMLGIGLKNDFLQGIQEQTVEQRWLDLRDGKEYEVNGITYKWIGFVNSKLQSPIANYVFCNLASDNQFSNTGIGEVKPLAENSTVIPPQYRISSVWTEMACFNHELYRFLTEFKDDYINWVPAYKSSLLKGYNVLGI